VINDVVLVLTWKTQRLFVTRLAVLEVCLYWAGETASR
jgi:hypothetical protein